MLVTQVGMGERKVRWSLIMWMISDRLSSRGERQVTCRDGCEIRDTRGGAERKQKLGLAKCSCTGKRVTTRRGKNGEAGNQLSRQNVERVKSENIQGRAVGWGGEMM